MQVNQIITVAIINQTLNWIYSMIVKIDKIVFINNFLQIFSFPLYLPISLLLSVFLIFFINSKKKLTSKKLS